MAFGRNKGNGNGGGGSVYGARRGGGQRKRAPEREFIKIAEVALWENPNGGDGKPVLYGSVTYEDGSESRISLWESTSDHEKAPVLNGSITEEVGGGEGNDEPF